MFKRPLRLRFLACFLALCCVFSPCMSFAKASDTNAIEKAKSALRRSLVELRKRNREIERLTIDLDTERKQSKAAQKAHLEQIAILRKEIARNPQPSNVGLVVTVISISVLAVLGIVGAGILGYEIGKRSGGGVK